jgi:hypothetical protein
MADFPDEAVFDKKKDVVKFNTFATLKKGCVYKVIKCESIMTGFGRRYRITVVDKAGAEFFLWAPADFTLKCKRDGIAWKNDFYFRFDGTEERQRRDEEGTYTGYLYSLYQHNSEKDKSKSKSKSKVKKDEGEESEA